MQLADYTSYLCAEKYQECIQMTVNFQDYLRATTSASVYKIRVTEGDGESEIDPNSLICIGTPQSSEYLKYFANIFSNILKMKY